MLAPRRTRNFLISSNSNGFEYKEFDGAYYVKEKKSTLITVTHDHELLKDFDRIVDFKELLSVVQ